MQTSVSRLLFLVQYSPRHGTCTFRLGTASHHFYTDDHSLFLPHNAAQHIQQDKVETKVQDMPLFGDQLVLG